MADILKDIEKSIKGELAPKIETVPEVSNIDADKGTDKGTDKNESSSAKNDIINSLDSKTPVGNAEDAVAARADKRAENNEKNDDSKNDGVDSPNKENKLSRRALAAKESQDKISKLESDLKLEKKQREQALNRLEQIQPFVDEWTKQERAKAEESRKKSIQDIIQNGNPDQIQEIINQRVMEAVMPFQQQAIEIKNKNFADNAWNTWQKMAGNEQTFNEIKPLMHSYLSEVIQKYGPQSGETLARNPDVLFRVARDMWNEQNRTKQTVEESNNLAKKKEMAQLNASISRPNQLTNSSHRKQNPRAEINDFLLKYSGQGR